jgi:hypothetical protein
VPNKLLTQVLGGLILASIIAIVTLAFSFNEKIARLEERVTNIKENLDKIRSVANSIENADSSITSDPFKLKDLIRNQQSQNVKTSYSETNCFTDIDLAAFIKEKKQDKIVSDLMNDNSFIDLIISIKNMTPSARQTLLDESKKIAKPTWGELGGISTNGQTETGKQAELLIANAIVSKINEMIKLPIDQLKKKYK